LLQLLSGLCPFCALVVVFPRSGQGLASTANWYDQQEFVQAVTDALSTGGSAMFTTGIVGPGYAALAIALHWMLGISPAQSLVRLSELSFTATGAVLVLFAFLQTRGASASTRLALIGLAAFLPFTSTWPYAADIPWTHFTETALLAGFVLLLSLDWRRPAVPFGFGFLGVLLYQTRSYEGMVLLFALALSVGVSFLADWRAARLGQIEARRLVAGCLSLATGVALATLIIFRTTGVALPFAQYSGTTYSTKLLFGLLPTKFTQLFVDPCYQTICTVEMTPGGNVPAIGLDNWTLPLSLQLPVLVAAGLSIMLLLVSSPSARAAILRPQLLVPLLTAGGLVLAYTSAAAAGSPHLRYGFMRDYIAPMTLLLMVALGLLAAVRDSGEVGRFRAAAWVLLISTFGLMGLRPIAGNPLPQFAFGGVAYTANCTETDCGFSVAATNLSGQPVVIAPDTVYGKTCGAQTEWDVADIAMIRLDRGKCTSIVLIPAVTGLYETPDPTRDVGQPVIPGATPPMDAARPAGQ